MEICRRAFLRSATTSFVGAGSATSALAWAAGSLAHTEEPNGRPSFDVRSFGAVADGKTIDTAAVNRAIAAAAAAGGGTVRFPPGAYACYSIHLQSYVALHLELSAIVLAAPGNGFDAAGSNAPFESYQDFGHNHWHNSLIWGENVHDVAIIGPGLICGRGLSRGEAAELGLPPADAPGVADKAIALKRCRNVIVRDVAVLAAGHFAILATGVDNLTLEALKIDTNRDGINVDCCRNVRISGCSVNSPWDDGICLKSTFALGEQRATENVTIYDCYVTGGFALGTMLNGTFRRSDANDGQPTGRIKCGTESSGGFKNIVIGNCMFENCRGFALESVDGGPIEDITFTNIVMRNICNAPFFLRLGARLRAPQGIGVGTFRRVMINNVICDAPTNDAPAIIAGIPGHLIEDVRVSDVVMVQKGGAAAVLADIGPPEQERDYPEPSFFGPLPAQGLLIRHARNVEFHHIEITSVQRDERPFIWLGDVDGADFSHLNISPRDDVPAIRLRDVRGVRLSGSRGLPETQLNHVTDGRIP
jgi:polygalacturonase